MTCTFENDGVCKAHPPYEFGVKVSVATPLRRCKGGKFVLSANHSPSFACRNLVVGFAHVAALPGNRYDGNTLATVVLAIERQNGAALTRVITDSGYRGHNAPLGRRRSVYTSGQKHGVTATIRRELRRRSAVEPVIGHVKAEHRMGRNYLAGRDGDATTRSCRPSATTSASCWPGWRLSCA